MTPYHTAGTSLCEPRTKHTHGKEASSRGQRSLNMAPLLQSQRCRRRTPGPGQVLIKLRAAGMNPMDRTLASGAWKPMPATFPMVLGADGAGVVEQLGEGASKFSLGDDLFGQC